MFSDAGGNTEIRSSADDFATPIAVIEHVSSANVTVDPDGNVTMSAAA